MKIRYSLPEAGSVLSCLAMKTGPSSKPSGSAAEAIAAVPIREFAGQVIGSVERSGNLPSSQVARLFGSAAAEGLIPIPGGSVTTASFVVESSWPVGRARCGTATVTCAPAGEFVSSAPGATSSEGVYGIVLQFFGEVPGGIGDSSGAPASCGKRAPASASA